MPVSAPIPGNVETINLFVTDLAETRAFYERAFAAREIYTDDDCTVLAFKGARINLLRLPASHELVEPRTATTPGQGPTMILTIVVDDVDALVTELQGRGVEFLNGPQDRPWGRRTAAFADPSGHVWELAQELDGCG